MKRVFIYRSEKKQDTYLYLPEKDKFDEIPETLIELLGELTFSFEFDIDENRKLIRAEATEVIKNIDEQGFFLQLAPSKFGSEEEPVH